MGTESMKLNYTNYVIYANDIPASPSRDEFATIKKENDIKDDSANFTIVMSHCGKVQFCTWLLIMRF